MAHPFDLPFDTLSKIKEHFPEYQNYDLPAGTHFNIKAKGILISKLKELLLPYIDESIFEKMKHYDNE